MNRSLFLFFITCLLLLGGFGGRCQDFPMLHYTVEDGLPSNIIYAVYRDSRGYLWVATDKGIAKFNGIKFEVFSAFNGLPDNEIFFFQEDYEQRLWLGSFNGELCYFQNDSFHTSLNTPFLALSDKVTHMRHISVESDSSLTITYFDPAKFVAIKNNRCKVFDLHRVNIPDVTLPLAFKKKEGVNKYRINYANKTVLIDTNYQVLETIKHDNDLVLAGQGFTACQDQEYLVSRKYVMTPFLKVKRTLPLNFNYGALQNIYINDRYAFYATSKGLLINDTIKILGNDNVSCVTQDNAGNYWVATLNNGLFALGKDFSKARQYSNVYTEGARYACAFNGHLFFVTSGGDLYDLHDGDVRRISDFRMPKSKQDRLGDFGFQVDRDYRYYNSLGRDFTVIDNLLSKKSVRIFRDVGEATKAIFLSAPYAYCKQHHSISRFRFDVAHGPPGVRSIGRSANNERIFGMAKSPDNSIWYSTVEKMYRVTNDDTDGIVQPQFKKNAFKYFDFFGSYLAGYTQNNLLVICSNYNSDKIKMDTPRLTRSSVLDKFYRIDDEHILIGTNDFFRLLTIDTNSTTGKFSIKLMDNPFIPLHTEAVCLDDKHGYFFKNGSITVLDLKTLLEKPAPPKVSFVKLISAGKKRYFIDKELEIPYSESRHMSIFFSALSFNAGKVKYQYSESKTNRDNWQDVNDDEINLVNSEYGTFYIKVKARSSSSEYCEPIVFTLHVLRPFWATWWFVGLASLAVLLISWLLLGYRITSILHKKEKEHAAELKFIKSEYKALNALMNPHFIFNTLNNVQSLVNRNDKLAANEYIRVFADLIRQNMHNISRDSIPLQKEMDLVTNYLVLEKLRFKELLNYRINIEDGIDLSEIIVPPLLVQPLVENSIKHGILPLESEGALINIDIFQKDRYLHIQVRDNGAGMAYQKDNDGSLHESFGLQNIRKRIEQLSIIQNKNILFDISESGSPDGKVQGTTATISIPVSL